MALPTSLRMHVIKSLCGDDIFFLNLALEGMGVLESVLDCHRTAQVLIIDEVSMISAELFEALEEVARKVRHSSNQRQVHSAG